MRTSLITGRVPAVLIFFFSLTRFLVFGMVGSAVPAGAQENPFDTTVDARMGRRVFRAECGRCHGRDAKGNDETGAPDLTTGKFTTASTDAGLFEVIKDGIAGTTMVGISWAPDQTIWQVVTYVNSLSINPGDYDLPGSATNGHQIFTGKGNCVSLPHGGRRRRASRSRSIDDRTSKKTRRVEERLDRTGRDGRAALVDDEDHPFRRLHRRGSEDGRGHVHAPDHG